MPEGHETEKGFGTGLRRQLQKRQDPADEAQETPAHIVAEEVLAETEPVYEPEFDSNGAPPAPDVEIIRSELASALGRERDLRAAMAEQAAMLERELAGPQGLNLRAAELDQRAATLAARENEFASREQELTERSEQLTA